MSKRDNRPAVPKAQSRLRSARQPRQLPKQNAIPFHYIISVRFCYSEELPQRVRPSIFLSELPSRTLSRSVLFRLRGGSNTAQSSPSKTTRAKHTGKATPPKAAEQAAEQSSRARQPSKAARAKQADQRTPSRSNTTKDRSVPNPPAAILVYPYIGIYPHRYLPAEGYLKMPLQSSFKADLSDLQVL